MCGIAGFIGVSKNPQITFQIATRLFDRLEERGNDAAGFWATEPGDDGSVVFHKEPGSSSKLIQQEIWRKTVAKMNLDLMVMHARRASAGADPKRNKNNHPFTSSDRSIALVHNGKLPEHHDLRKKYEVRSDTDSEVLLRIFEWASINTTEVEAQSEFPSMDWLTASKVVGIKKIFSYINTGVMASAIAERGTENGERSLWLFRNSMPAGQQDRPLFVIDVRDKLGQIFFCSTHEIWRKALSDCPQARQFIGRRWCIDVPADEIWYFNTSNDLPIADDSSCKKMDVTKGHVWRPLEDVSSPLPIISTTNERPFSIISYLNEQDDLELEDIPKVQYKKQGGGQRWYPIGGSDHEMAPGSLVEISEPGVRHLSEKESEEKDEDVDDVIDVEFNEFGESFDMASLTKTCDEIKRLASDIETTVQNKHMEGSISIYEFQSILEHLESHKLDLSGTLTIAEQE